MFDSLGERLSRTMKNIRGQDRITEDNVNNTLREIRIALLESDVALDVVREFIERVKQKAMGGDVMHSITPGQALVKMVNDQLIAIMGGVNESLNLNTQPPAIILIAGLQGAGKTTTVAKLAKWLREKKQKSVMLASSDIYRPAAIEQLRILSNEVNAKFFTNRLDKSPVEIARSAVVEAKLQCTDVIIIDTAGRLHVDNRMMAEIKKIYTAIHPIETLFTVDSMTGQDAANTAQAFNDVLPLTGVILTKMDGDARAGAALSIRYITGKPIKFIGVGERMDALEPFYPDRVVSRILGMGDVVSLVENAQQKIDKDAAEQLASKLKQGKNFDLEDFRTQLRQMEKMGGMSSILEKIPRLNNFSNTPKKQIQANNKELNKLEAIIDSMTQKERKRPNIIKGSRKKRIASGSGMKIQDVNRLLKQFNQMQKMMKKISKRGGMARMLQGLKSHRPMDDGSPFQY
ncbi:MAG: signal recognition particle protein [Piscirickettsiaceae bacterium]|nr:signal recognition particle protein [Piscirickettsiaceae bacterium]